MRAAVILFLAVTAGCSKQNALTPGVIIPTSGYSTPSTYPGMNAVWSDEFDGTTVNSSYWSFESGAGGWGNQELEYYQPSNATLLQGTLLITARAETAGYSSFTSSRMITKDKFSFRYGRIDVRAVLPKGQGLWPAIWMLGANIDTVGWPTCGEVDIMEMIGGGGRENTIYGTAHWDQSGHNSSGGQITIPSGDAPELFHVYSLIWTTTNLSWYVDDVKYHDVDIAPASMLAFQKKFFLILNVAVGGSWPGNPDSSTSFPQRMIVDYVRVFQNP